MDANIDMQGGYCQGRRLVFSDVCIYNNTCRHSSPVPNSNADYNV